jgi:Glycosyl hydrolases family 17
VLVSYISQIRAGLKGTGLANILIGHTDRLSAWVNSSNSAVVSAVDWLGIDLQPYLDYDIDSTVSNSIADDSNFFQNEYDATAAVSNGKQVWVTETGWPTSGGESGQAVASTSNAKQYWDDVGCGLFGKTNTWWYNLFADVTSSPDWGVVYTNSTTLYDLSCDGVTPKLTLNSSQVNEAAVFHTDPSFLLLDCTGFSTLIPFDLLYHHHLIWFVHSPLHQGVAPQQEHTHHQIRGHLALPPQEIRALSTSPAAESPASP